MRVFLLLFIITSSLLSCGGDGAFSIAGEFYKKVYVKERQVSLRINPSTVATRMDVVPYNTELKILRQGAAKKRIGSSTDYWYLVRLPNGVEGWVFGNGISFSKNPEVFAEQASDKTEITSKEENKEENPEAEETPASESESGAEVSSDKTDASVTEPEAKSASEQ
jgi:hypothetical protein